MKYLKITTEYVLPISEEFEATESDISAGVTRMEGIIRREAKHIIEVSSSWEWIEREQVSIAGEDAIVQHGRAPRRLNPDPIDREIAKRMIEADEDKGINFLGDVMGERFQATHPYDQGLYIFPDDHPLRALEERILREGSKEELDELRAASPKLKQIGGGSGTERDAEAEPEDGSNRSEESEPHRE